MTNRMTTQQLEAIRKRAEKAMNGNPLEDANVLARMDRVILEDIPALLAEVERLRKALEFYGDQFNYANYAEVIRKDFGNIAREAIRNDNE